MEEGEKIEEIWWEGENGKYDGEKGENRKNMLGRRKKYKKYDGEEGEKNVKDMMG